MSQAGYLDKACGSRRHCYNQLLEHFLKPENTWSRASAYQYYIEDLNVKGRLGNRKLARSIADAGFGMLRQFIEYKAYLRGTTVIVADRFYPSSRLCSGCGQIHEITLADRALACDCGLPIDRDLNAAINLNNYRRDTLKPDVKCTQELRKTAVCGIGVDGVNKARSL